MTWAKLATPMACALRGDGPGVQRVVTAEFRAGLWWDDLFCWWIAECLALVGDTDSAVQFLERAVELGMINHPFLSGHDPFLSGLRGQEGFERLMTRVRSAWERFEA